MTSRPLSVLIVARDRSILRRLSKALGAFGYAVREAADPSQGLASIEAITPDMMIVDSDPDPESALEFCGTVGSRIHPGHIHTFLLVADPNVKALQEALQAEVDDFLIKPIVYGELLARLRAGARLLEFERRHARQAVVDPLTGLPSRTTFHDQMDSELARGGGLYRTEACVLVDVDSLGRINRLHGTAATDEVIRAVASKVDEHCGQSDLLASFTHGRFAAWVRQKSEEEAVAWATAVCEDLAQMDIPWENKSLRVTASAGVAGFREGDQSLSAVLDRAQAALLDAKHSGRNCVARFGQFDADAAEWTEIATPGRLFARTVASDVMTPCTLTLRPEDPASRAAELLRQSKTEGLPVVDADGNLVGYVLPNTGLETSSNEALVSQSVRDVMAADVPIYGEETDFAQLMDFFTSDTRSLIAIVHEGVPTGHVTPNSLAALSMPLTDHSFEPTGPYSSRSEYLGVSDLCPLDAE